jgi:hypothetical protein
LHAVLPVTQRRSSIHRQRFAWRLYREGVGAAGASSVRCFGLLVFGGDSAVGALPAHRAEKTQGLMQLKFEKGRLFNKNEAAFYFAYFPE